VGASVLLVAHRMPAERARVEALAAAGAAVFEVDVQVGPAGLVVSHFVPVRGFGGRLMRDTWRLRWKGTDPLLDAHLANRPPGTRVLLDLKEHDPQRRVRLVETIIASMTDREHFVISTGNRRNLADLRAAGFETWHSFGEGDTLSRLLAAGEIAGRAVTVRHTVLSPALVQRLHADDRQVIAWTVNRIERARELVGWGVDGITTDRREVLHALATDAAT
jgi:hypothetical protein